MAEEKEILDFTIPEENLPWRKQTDLKTSEKLTKIIKYISIDEQKRNSTHFGEIMKDAYIFDSNVSCSVGEQKQEEIRRTVAMARAAGTDPNLTPDQQITWNLENALEKIGNEKLHQHSIETLQDLHRVVMKNLHSPYTVCNPGMLRIHPSQTTRPDGSVHYYPDPLLVKHMLKGVMDQHEIHMANIPDESEDKLKYIIKSAAWLLARFVSIHPFSDGNGRMCRLLANLVLSRMIPFPIHVYKTGLINREHYVNGIIECQDDNGDPLQLSAMLVDSIYDGFREIQIHAYDDEEIRKQPETNYTKKHTTIITIQTETKEEAWRKVQEVFARATDTDKQKFEEFFALPEERNQYKELILEDPTVQHDEYMYTRMYIVRIFRRNH